MAMEVESLPELVSPFELFDVKDGEGIEFVPVGYERGRMTIYPHYLPPGTAKVVPVIRIHTEPRWKEIFPHYWDITSKTLQAQLIPHFERPDYRNFKYKVTKHGVAPRARFTLEVVPFPL